MFVLLLSFPGKWLYLQRKFKNDDFMKKNSTLLMVLLAALMSFSFTSCEEDEAIARTLAGAWEGDTAYGRMYDGYYYDSYRTQVYFDKDPYRYSSGRGVWVDYFKSHPWSSRYDYIANHITWDVTWQVITIHFIEDDYTIEIWDYSLTDNYFTGEIRQDGEKMRFRLYHIDSPYWDSGWHWGWDDGYYWGNEAQFDAEEVKKPVPVIVPAQ